MHSTKFCFYDRFDAAGKDFFEPRRPRPIRLDRGDFLEATLCSDGVWRCLEVEAAQREKINGLLEK